MRQLCIMIPLTLLCCTLWAQERSLMSDIRFGQGRYDLDRELENNARLIDTLTLQLNGIKNDPSMVLTSIRIDSYSSPEGDLRFNRRLSQSRCDAVEAYIRGIIEVPDSLMVKNSHGVAWDRLREMVANSDMVDRKKILKVIDTTPEETWENGALKDSRNRQLMLIKSGEPYVYMLEHFYPYLRGSVVITIRYRQVASTVAKSIKLQVNRDTLQRPTADIMPIKGLTPWDFRRPMFALKTNLLFDVLLTPNLELEVPIGRHWSVNAEFMRGWWLRRDNTFCWQVEAGGLEGRYWFKNIDRYSVLTGWFAGVFAGGGFYDFQLKRDEGYQGEFYLLAGLSGGYATPIARNLHLEFSLGIGYIVTDYRHYHVIDDELVKQGSAMRFSSIFPAKAKVSLVWVVNRKVKRGATK